MYKDRKTAHKKVLWIAAVIVAVLIAIPAVFLLHDSGYGIRQDASDAIEQTIRRTALQCYAVEGVYPSSLDYLQENYGLQINTEDYYITYEAYASNQPPEIRVTAKNG